MGFFIIFDRFRHSPKKIKFLNIQIMECTGHSTKNQWYAGCHCIASDFIAFHHSECHYAG